MHRALPFQIALIALFLTACSTGAPPSGGSLDGPLTTITLATAERGVSASGVPFVGGQPVVTDVSVAVSASTIGDPVALRFTLVDDVYTYDPDGDLTSLEFSFAENVTVTLPADALYTFATHGDDLLATWIAYGETVAPVDVATTSVTLALQTLIQDATLDADPSITAIAASQTVDLLLHVTAPGGYDVPTADYAVAYAIGEPQGTVVASSKLGAQAVAHAAPVDNYFTVTATVTGWRNDEGQPVWVDALDGVVATFEVPFTNPTGLGFDTEAPIASILAPATGNVGNALALSGTATDDGVLDRVQVFVGPVLIASSDDTEAVGDVELLQLVGGAWSFGWTPSVVRTHTFTVLAVDMAGNEHRASTTVDVGVALRTLTFDPAASGSATVTAGETLILSGPAVDGFVRGRMFLYLEESIDTGEEIPTWEGLQVANGMWTLSWTAPAAGTYVLWFNYSEPFMFAEIDLTVE